MLCVTRDEPCTFCPKVEKVLVAKSSFVESNEDALSLYILIGREQKVSISVS